MFQEAHRQGRQKRQKLPTTRQNVWQSGNCRLAGQVCSTWAFNFSSSQIRLWKYKQAFAGLLHGIEAMQFGLICARSRHHWCQLHHLPTAGELSISLQTSHFTWPLLTYRVPRKVLWWALRNLGIEELNDEFVSRVSTARSFELDSVCIRDLFSTPCFSYLCWCAT